MTVASVMAVSTALIAKLIVDLENESEDESSEDDDTLIAVLLIGKRSMKKPLRIENYIENVVFNFTAQQFQHHFRITTQAYENLLRILAPRLERAGNIGRQRINLDKQILSVLWLLSTPDSYRSVGDRFDMGKSSLSICFMRVIKVLGELAPRVINWPTGERLEEVKRGFYRMGGIENIAGAVDGTFVPIKAPKVDAHSYITRKCNFAITLQGICDHQLKFTDVFVGYPGSVNDARIFRNSPIYSQIQNDYAQFFPNGEFIIGDKAYPVLTWCVPLYIDRGNLTRAQRNFNTQMSKTRQIIERVFALLFGRFRRLKFVDMNRNDCIPATVLAACVLHNLCLDYGDLMIEEYIQEGVEFVLNEENLVRIHQENVQQGRQKRDEICQRLHQAANNVDM